MTSKTCNCAAGKAVPTPTPRPSKPTGNAGRKRGVRCLKRRTRRAADRATKPNYRLRIPERLFDFATEKGFILVDRGRRSSDLKLQCNRCDQHLQVRRSVLINNAVECKHCLWQDRFAQAMSAGATILTPDPTSHKHVNLVLSCGHTVQRQYNRLATAADGGHHLGCAECRELRYIAEAEGSGWELVGPATKDKIGYRHYLHACGHCQDHAIVNVDNRQLDCAGCGETWASKPSSIYLFTIDLADQMVLKFGYSSNPERRLRQQLGAAARDTGKILRVIDFPTGRAALTAEKKAHRKLCKAHPHWVVDKDVFAGWIKTKSEIYDPAAESIILDLMDEIAGDVRRQLEELEGCDDQAAATPRPVKRPKT